VLNTHQASEINNLTDESIDKKNIVFTDKSTSYVGITDFVELHVTEKSKANI